MTFPAGPMFISHKAHIFVSEAVMYLRNRDDKNAAFPFVNYVSIV